MRLPECGGCNREDITDFICTSCSRYLKFKIKELEQRLATASDEYRTDPAEISRDTWSTI